MKFLLDENLSPQIADELTRSGHDVVHVRDLDIQSESDAHVLVVGRQSGRVIISADTDFGELLSRSNASSPSLLLLRRQQQRRASQISAIILANLDAVCSDLEVGAVVVLDSNRVRVRSLPLQPA